MRIRFFSQLEQANSVLLAGAGGGLDIFAGLPIYFWLRSLGKTVHLANLSFTEIGFCEGERPVPSLLRVVAETPGPTNYFPEVHLARWLANRGDSIPIYAIERTGARPVVEAYQWLAHTLKPEALVLVDGGMDSLMCGDEVGLGTPQEDIVSLLGAHSVSGVSRKLLACIGFGVDAFHGICHAQFLENVAALIQDDGYLGAWALTREMHEFDLYRQASEFVVSRMPQQPSIVNASIISAAEGRFGDFHTTKRTEGSTLFINPLMSIYWGFDLEKVANRNLYLKQIAATESYQQLSMAIQKFRAMTKTRDWMEIPC